MKKILIFLFVILLILFFSKNHIIGQKFDYEKLILGIGILSDKDADEMVKTLAPLADEVVITEVKMPRKMKVEKLGEIVKKYNSNITLELVYNSYFTRNILCFR